MTVCLATLTPEGGYHGCCTFRNFKYHIGMLDSLGVWHNGTPNNTAPKVERPGTPATIRQVVFLLYL